MLFLRDKSFDGMLYSIWCPSPIGTIRVLVGTLARRSPDESRPRSGGDHRSELTGNKEGTAAGKKRALRRRSRLRENENPNERELLAGTKKRPLLQISRLICSKIKPPGQPFDSAGTIDFGPLDPDDSTTPGPSCRF